MASIFNCISIFAVLSLFSCQPVGEDDSGTKGVVNDTKPNQKLLDSSKDKKPVLIYYSNIPPDYTEYKENIYLAYEIMKLPNTLLRDPLRGLQKNSDRMIISSTQNILIEEIEKDPYFSRNLDEKNWALKRLGDKLDEKGMLDGSAGFIDILNSYAGEILKDYHTIRKVVNEEVTQIKKACASTSVSAAIFAPSIDSGTQSPVGQLNWLRCENGKVTTENFRPNGFRTTNETLLGQEFARPETLKNALATVENAFPSEDNKYILVTKSHGSARHALTTKLSADLINLIGFSDLEGVSQGTSINSFQYALQERLGTVVRRSISEDAKLDQIAQAGGQITNSQLRIFLSVYWRRATVSYLKGRAAYEVRQNKGATLALAGSGGGDLGEGNPSLGEGNPSLGEGNPSLGEGNPSLGEGSANPSLGKTTLDSDIEFAAESAEIKAHLFVDERGVSKSKYVELIQQTMTDERYMQFPLIFVESCYSNRFLDQDKTTTIPNVGYLFTSDQDGLSYSTINYQSIFQEVESKSLEGQENGNSRNLLHSVFIDHLRKTIIAH